MLAADFGDVFLAYRLVPWNRIGIRPTRIVNVRKSHG